MIGIQDSTWYMATEKNHTDVVQLLTDAGAKSTLNFPDGLPLPIVQQWQATINNNGSDILLGTFNTKEEARTAVTEARKEMNLIEGTPSRIFRLKKKE